MTQISAARSRKRLVLLALLIAAAIGAVFVYLKHTSAAAPATGAGSTAAASPGGRHGGPGMTDPNLAVSVAVGTASTADVPVIEQALGTVIPNYSVTVTSRVDGELMAVYFTEGQYVKKGQLLAQIDPRAYQATLDQYQGDMAQNQALLKSAQLTVERYKRLFAKDSIAKQDLDTQTATVGQYAGAVKADQGQIDAAKLNLIYAKIVSPIDGFVGLRLVDPGNIVSSSSTTGIVTVTQTNPIAVTFSLPQAQLATLLPKVRKGEALSVQAMDQLGSTPLATGTLKFISNEIDTSTGSIKLKAQFDNPDEKLYPNQFVNVKLTTDTLRDAVVVPSAAVQLSSDGEFLYVVKDGKVSRRSVKVGPALGEQTVISQGVDKGDQVVTRGIDHLREGSKVEIEKPVSTDVVAGKSPTPAAGNVTP
jgi:multidrug efflux system membrane fusion protein